MHLSYTLSLLPLLSSLPTPSTALYLPSVQLPLHPSSPLHTNTLTKRPTRAQVLKILEKAEVIPTVLDVFYPTFLLNVTWGPHASAALGNLIDVDKMQGRPEVVLEEPRVPKKKKKGKKGKHGGDDDDDDEDEEEEEDDDEILSGGTLATMLAKTPLNNLVLTMTDPDAPTRSDPKWSEMCHWIAIGLSTNYSSSSSSPSSSSTPSTLTTLTTTTSHPFKDILSYKPPAPPAGTGKHRYVLTAWAPANGTTTPLELVPPKERRHWGREGGGYGGVRDWAAEMGLAVVGANFFYAEHA